MHSLLDNSLPNYEQALVHSGLAIDLLTSEQVLVHGGQDIDLLTTEQVLEQHGCQDGDHSVAVVEQNEEYIHFHYRRWR